MTFPASVVVTGQAIDLSSYTEGTKRFYIDLLGDIRAAWNASGKARFVVGFAGPSGAGKSTLLAILATLGGTQSVLAVGIDGYHFSNAILGSRGLMEHKGRFDTYDAPRLLRDLEAFRGDEDVRFPMYSRESHEPLADGPTAMKGTKALLLLEGLWILSEKEGWRDMRSRVDLMYYVDVDPEKGKRQTLARHVRGGRSLEDAQAFYTKSDAMNAAEVAKGKAIADRIITLP